MACAPCQAAKKAASSMSPFKGCEGCKKRMAKLEQKAPKVAKAIRPLHEALVGDTPRKGRVLGSK